MRYLLGIDNGGTFSKAAIFDEDGNQIGVASQSTEMITPKAGYCERNMDDLWKVNTKIIQDVIRISKVEPADIIGVSFSGHGKGLYLVGEDGEHIYNGILSTDNRAWSYVKTWEADGTNKKVFEKSCQKILACQPVSLLAWLRDNEPEVLEKTKYIFAVKDYIRYRLTGEAFAEYTDFSGANLVNLSTKAYDPELLAYFGLDMISDKLPTLRYSADICGYITKEASELTGLIEGTKVAAGMFDVDACGIASGLINEDGLCMIAGTWSINEFVSKVPIINGSVDLNSMYAIPGYYLVEESSPTSAGNMEWFIRNLLSHEKELSHSEGKSIYEMTEEWVSSVEPYDSNILFLPFLNGSNEDVLAKGSFIGLTEFHNKKHMLRAVYEGIVFSHLTHVNKLLVNREKPSRIQLAGGAAKSKVWVQIFSDVLQIPIDLIEEKELGAQGAAIAAGIAVGIYANYTEAIKKTVHITDTIYPRVDYKEIYEKKYHTYRRVIEALNGVWDSFEESQTSEEESI